MAMIEERIYNGDQARLVLENEAFSAAFADIKSEYMAALIASPARDVEGREKLYQLIKLTEKLQATLTGAMEDGKLARAQLNYDMEAQARQRADGMGQMYQ